MAACCNVQQSVRAYKKGCPCRDVAAKIVSAKSIVQFPEVKANPEPERCKPLGQKRQTLKHGTVQNVKG